MAYLRSKRGTGQHAQLIGGEVALLGPEDHAAALEIMERHGRKPMSMTHGDFDYEYLETLLVAPPESTRLLEGQKSWGLKTSIGEAGHEGNLERHRHRRKR